MNNTFTIYNSKDKYFKIIGGVVYMLLGASYFYNEIDELRVFDAFIFIAYTIIGFVFIFQGVKHCAKTQIKCTEDVLRITWKKSVKFKVIQNKDIQKINLSKEYLKIHTLTKEDLKYFTSDFSNEERKSLLTFLKYYFKERLL